VLAAVVVAAGLWPGTGYGLTRCLAPDRTPVWSSAEAIFAGSRDQAAPPPRADAAVRVRRESAGRRGKPVTTISELRSTPPACAPGARGPLRTRSAASRRFGRRS
jgi:hypothetical protein